MHGPIMNGSSIRLPAVRVSWRRPAQSASGYPAICWREKGVASLYHSLKNLFIFTIFVLIIKNICDLSTSKHILTKSIQKII